jgi:hypothetical protein
MVYKRHHNPYYTDNAICFVLYFSPLTAVQSIDNYCYLVSILFVTVCSVLSCVNIKLLCKLT